MPASFEVVTGPVPGRPDAALVVAAGPLGSGAALDLERAIAAALEGGAIHLVVDMAGVQYFSSLSVSVLEKVAGVLAGKGGGLAIIRAPKRVTVVVQMLGFERLWAMADDVAAALGKLEERARRVAALRGLVPPCKGAELTADLDHATGTPLLTARGGESGLEPAVFDFCAGAAALGYRRVKIDANGVARTPDAPIIARVARALSGLDLHVTLAPCSRELQNLLPRSSGSGGPPWRS
jgi:anti-anti-sigma factor